MKRILVLMALYALSMFAADISGTWKGTLETPNGKAERTFVFKVDGEKLTGETTSSMMGKSEIMNGKISGDSISFTIKIKFQDNELDVDYKGKVMGNEIKFTVDAGGNTLEYSVEKVS